MERKGVSLPSTTSPRFSQFPFNRIDSRLLPPSDRRIVESLEEGEARVSMRSNEDPIPGFVRVGSLSTCRHYVTLYRVNLEGFSLRSSKGITPCAVCLFVDGTNRSGARDIVFSLSDSVFFCCRCRCCSTRNFGAILIFCNSQKEKTRSRRVLSLGRAI